MNPRNTWRWIAVAAVLFAFIFFYQRRVGRNGSQPARVLPNLKAAAVTSIQIRPGARAPIRADRTNGVWQLVAESLVYPAQAASIEKLLAELERLTPAPYITARELRDRLKLDEAYGFSNPQATIAIEQPEHTAHLLIGARTPPGDQVFLQVVGMDGVYMVDADFLKYIPRTAEDWRDTTLVDLRSLTFDRLAVTNGAKAFELRRDATNKLWRMVYPLQARANNAKVEESLQLLQGVRILRFLTDDPKVDVEPFGLQPPELELALGQGTNPAVRLQFGRSPTNDTRLAYARRLGLSSVVAVPKDLLAPWYASVNDFRDPLLAKVTAPVAVVDVRSQDSFSLRQQTNGAWRVLPQGFSADAGLVKGLLSALNAFRIVAFTNDVVTAPDLAAYALAPPARQYILKSAATNAPGGPTNVVLAELNFGTNQADKVFAQRADEPGFVYAVRLADFQRLPAASWQMRERQIWNFSTNDVAGATLRQQGRVRKIVRNGPHDWTLAPGITNDLAVEETVSGFCQLTTAAWAAHGATDRARFGFTDNDLQITLELKGGDKVSVELGSEAPGNVPYALITLDGGPWVFECPAWLYVYAQRFLSVPPNP
jgi:Domain of unknown function (DUF4340)